MRFQPGTSGNPHGRPRGHRNTRTVEIEQLAQGLLQDPAYQARLKQRLLDGQAPHLEILLFHYAYGKPVARLEHTLLIRQVAERLAQAYDLDVEALIAEAERLARG